MQELFISRLIGIHLFQVVELESDERITAWWLVVSQFSEVEGLDEDSNHCSCAANDHLVLVVLSDYESNEEINAEDIGINLQEVELNLIVNGLHAIVVVDVHLVLYVQVDKHHENEEEHKWYLKGKEGNQRPKFEENDELELDREARVLHPFVKNLLAADRPILVLYLLSASVPTAKHQVEASQRDLNDDEVDGLIADER